MSTDTRNLSGIAKLESSALTEFQLKLHQTKPPRAAIPDPQNPDGPPLKPERYEELNSRFHTVSIKTSWSTHVKVKLTSRQEDDEVVYSPPSKTYDFLLYTYLCRTLPAITVKDSYRGRVNVCWTHSPGLNHIERANLCLDDDKLQTFDYIWMNIASQRYGLWKPHKRDLLDRMIGNIPFLQEWSSFLPEFTVMTPQPWSYCMDDSRAFPLLLATDRDRNLIHRYTFRWDVAKMLRMRALVMANTDKYVLIPSTVFETTLAQAKAHLNDEGLFDDDGRLVAKWVNIGVKYDYLDAPPKQLPMPELWGGFATVSAEEKAWLLSRSQKIWIDDIVPYTTDNPSETNAHISINLDSNSPCKVIHVVAENLTAVKNRYYGNFTTNADNHNLGWNPILSKRLTYGTAQRIPEMSSNHFEFAESWYHFHEVCTDPGYNAMSVAYDSSSLESDVGIVFKGRSTVLTVKLGNTDPFIKKMHQTSRTTTQEEAESTDEPIIEEDLGVHGNQTHVDRFRIQARLMVMRHLKFPKDKKKPIVLSPSITS